MTLPPNDQALLNQLCEESTGPLSLEECEARCERLIALETLHATLDRRSRWLVRVMLGNAVLLSALSFSSFSWGRAWFQLGQLATQLLLFWYLYSVVNRRTAAIDEIVDTLPPQLRGAIAHRGPVNMRRWARRSLARAPK